MTTRAETLFAGAVDAVRAGIYPSVAAQNVFRENAFALDEETELPAITAHKSRDGSGGDRTYRDGTRSLTMVFGVYTKRATSHDLELIRQRLNQIMHNDVFNSVVLNPMDVEETDVDYAYDRLNGAVVSAQITYQIRYSQNENAL